MLDTQMLNEGSAKLPRCLSFAGISVLAATVFAEIFVNPVATALAETAEHGAAAGHAAAGLETLFWPVVNFVTYLFVMVYVYRKLAKPALLRRYQQVKSDLDRAAQELRLAQAEYSDAEERLKLIASEKSELIERYELEAKQMGETVIRNARAAAERSITDTARQIETEISQAEKELRRESIGLATTLVRKQLQAQLKDDDDRRIRKLVVSEVMS